MAKVCLIVIDGWGISEETKGTARFIMRYSRQVLNDYLDIGNAIKNADTPVMDALSREAGGYTTLDASGLSVGLPVGLMGNSEVGHFTIGTGRIVYQVRGRYFSKRGSICNLIGPS